jgi:quinol monooxygenase YgiN
MTFQEDKISEFLQLFEMTQGQIRAFAGCRHLELWQDNENHCTFVTYSHWESPESLENYKNSPLFKSTWSKTKALFSDKPRVYSMRRFHN